MRVVCLDTHILIWGVKEEAVEGQEHVVPAAKRFLYKLEQEKAVVIVPSVILYELLMPIPTNKQLQFINRMRSDWMVMPLDVPAAQKAAQVWHSKHEEGVIEEIKKDPKFTRSMAKVDTLIIGTAIEHGASCIYSHDGPMARMADGFIDVSHMDVDPSLFDPRPPEPTHDEDEHPDSILSSTDMSPQLKAVLKERLEDELEDDAPYADEVIGNLKKAAGPESSDEED